MKTVNVRELRGTIPRLKPALPKADEPVLVSNGEPAARLAPVEPRGRRLSSLKVTTPLSTLWFGSGRSSPGASGRRTSSPAAAMPGAASERIGADGSSARTHCTRVRS